MLARLPRRASALVHWGGPVNTLRVRNCGGVDLRTIRNAACACTIPKKYARFMRNFSSCMQMPPASGYRLAPGKRGVLQGVIMRTLAFGAVALLGGTLLSTTANAQCPAAGNDTGCGAVITITNGHSALTATGQGPYDGSDDTLIGVVNNSSVPISSIQLTSGNNIFGFDGDGVNGYLGIPNNAKDTTGYGGPNAYFTNINSSGTVGTVNFITPIAPNGGTGYFSLENALTSGSACKAALDNAVPKPAGGTAEITTTFTPQGGNNLAQAATLCGFIAWNWQQTITVLPLPGPGNSFNAIATPNTVPTAPFNDPPPSGYVYMLTWGSPVDAPHLAVYYDPFNNAGGMSINANETPAGANATVLSFYDSPADPCLPGGSLTGVSKANGGCGGTASPGTISFTTHLVGLQGQLPGAAVVDTGIGFNWTSNNNGTVGGVAVTAVPKGSPAPTGTGGVTVTGYTATTNYLGVGVSQVNGNPSGASPLLAAMLPVSRSSTIGSPTTGTVTAFATIINTDTVTGTGCSIAPTNSLPASFTYQTTSSATNALTGTANTPVNIPGNNGLQSFVIAFTPTAAISPTNVQFSFSCSNENAAPVNVGLNTLLLSASASPTPDVIALVATTKNDGIVHVTTGSLPSATGAFAVASDNLGAGASITVGTNTGGATLPINITICQTNASGQCLQTPTASVTTTISTNSTPTFGVFVTATSAVPFDPANNRIFVTFTDSGNAVRGETSVAVETQ
jgi:hypothetical protein